MESTTSMTTPPEEVDNLMRVSKYVCGSVSVCMGMYVFVYYVFTVRVGGCSFVFVWLFYPSIFGEYSCRYSLKLFPVNVVSLLLMQ